MTRSLQKSTIIWRGFEIEIRYEATWLCCAQDDRIGHLAIKMVEPESMRLPISHTGYRSYFANPVEVDAAGGPVAFVTDWLNEAAQAPAWQEQSQDPRQCALT
ncbi:hypothetical protein GCM10007276_08720 [Agaricicola taiwanensis]|uniref:Uncharacterized protein n=1 Tax=Agaricicola taiwanensis TaxID=591372 RepID=A0A8J2VK50_9RHOB|nr:hypothetical protein [Agaricicola taiwanensis]GGE33663.1 hypothetical protein GCM10007276_08720 [Agaricicola taiwanensis]